MPTPNFTPEVTPASAMRMMRLSPNGDNRVLEKDAMPNNYHTTHLYNTGGYWSLATGEVISDVVQGGSQLLNWIPSRGVDTVESRVAHLSWVGPKGFDASQTYGQFLAALPSEDQCGYGPSADWSGFEYAHTGSDVSATSDVLKPKHWGGRYVDEQPIMRINGPQAGETLKNDAQWALAQAGIVLEGHLNWNVVWGNEAAYKYTYQGIDQIIRPGWVASHVIGSGIAYWSDPLYWNGAALTDAGKRVQAVQAMVRHILKRAVDHGGSLGPNDIAIVMSSAHWQDMSNAIALGQLMAAAPAGMTVNITPEGFFRERDRITTGYFGNGYIPVDGKVIPVIIEDLLAVNATLSGGVAGAIGDIYVLVRTFRGMTILENQYLDWNKFQGYPTNGTEVIMQNGMLRTGWVEEANKCFYYYAEMEGRLLTKFQPLQGRITDVAVPTEMANYLESGTFGSRDWYPHWPVQGGNGVPLVRGRNA